MQQLITGTEYDDFEFHDSLVKCLNQTDPLLYQSVNLQWKHFFIFSKNGGNRPDDAWYSCDEEDAPSKV